MYFSGGLFWYNKDLWFLQLYTHSTHYINVCVIQRGSVSGYFIVPVGRLGLQWKVKHSSAHTLESTKMKDTTQYNRRTQRRNTIESTKRLGCSTLEATKIRIQHLKSEVEGKLKIGI